VLRKTIPIDMAMPTCPKIASGTRMLRSRREKGTRKNNESEMNAVRIIAAATPL